MNRLVNRVLWMARMVWNETDIIGKVFLCALAGGALASALSGYPGAIFMLIVPGWLIITSSVSLVIRKEDQRQKDVLLDFLTRATVELSKHDPVGAREITRESYVKLIDESIVMPPSERAEWMRP